MFSIAQILAFGLLATSVSAHGGVAKYTWGGTDYTGWSPYNSASGQSTIQRKYSSYDPILTPVGTNIRCNNAGETSQLTASIAAGSEITATWAQWTHAEGPVTVYMAKCPGACSSFDGSGAVWFKIDEAGLMSGTVGKGSWGNTVILDTLKWTSTIPATLAPGEYLIRHEVLALHQANTPQFYPECAQLTVTGSGSASPSSEYLISLPGGIQMSDPGVTIDIYAADQASNTVYVVPGPKVWTGGSSGTSPTSPASSVTSAPATTKTSTTSAAPATSSTAAAAGVAKYGQCGGQGWSGATTCISSTCTKVNDYYSQCL
ncbi:glycosyl hydrolase family 61-domain-containing protein [Geopyxis carbonaria]|nr:glycosyl hydrolase family 61-domain-containing protein [Geopyxis carbonaria]